MNKPNEDLSIYDNIVDGELNEIELQRAIGENRIDAQTLRSQLECDELIRQSIRQDQQHFTQQVHERIRLEADGAAFTAQTMQRVHAIKRRSITLLVTAAAILVGLSISLTLINTGNELMSDEFAHEFSDGSHIQFSASSEVSWQTDALGQSINLKHGQLSAQISKQKQQRYLFNTKEGSVLVRGTAFDLSQDHLQSIIDLQEGAVDVSSADTSLRIKAPSRVRFMRCAAPQIIPLQKHDLFIITDAMSYDDYLAIIEASSHPSFKLCGIIATAGSVPYNQDVHHVAQEIRNILKHIKRQDIPVLIGAQGIQLHDSTDIPAIEFLQQHAQRSQNKIAIANFGSYQVVTAAFIQQYPATAKRCLLANLAIEHKGSWQSVRTDGQEAFQYVRDHFPGRHYLLDENMARAWTSIRLADLDALQTQLGKRIRERVTYTTKTMPIWDQSLIAVLNQACLENNTDTDLIIVEQLPPGNPEELGLRTLQLLP